MTKKTKTTEELIIEIENLEKQLTSITNATAIWNEINPNSKCWLCSAILWNKIALVLLVAIEIFYLCYWSKNPTEGIFEELIAPILLAAILFTLILLLGISISKEERKIAKQRAELEKEVFMRRLK